MANFTIVMDWNKGTYIAQSVGKSKRAAVYRWATELDVELIEGMGEVSKAKLIAEIRDELPTPVEGLKNVWCYATVVRGKLLLLHVILTDDRGSQ